MKEETLLQRCQREAREKINTILPFFGYEELSDAQLEAIDTLIANTLKEASEEIGRLGDVFEGVELADHDRSYLAALTDAQKVLGVDLSE